MYFAGRTCTNQSLLHKGKEYASPLALYNHRVAQNLLKNDDEQRNVISSLEELNKNVASYVPTPPKKAGIFSKVPGLNVFICISVIDFKLIDYLYFAFLLLC